MSNTRCSTSFGADYASKAHLQESFNEKTIKEFAKRICQLYNEGKYGKSPITIVDLACGHGKPTHDLLQRLEELAVPINEIIGYDISDSQINKAKTDYSGQSKLVFEVQDIEKINDVKKFDVAVSFFGLHWVNDIINTAKLIATSLKPGGSLMFFVPLEMMDLFEARKEFLSHPAWKKYFKNFSIKPFLTQGKDYTEAFRDYIDPTSLITKQGEEKKYYTKEEMVKFLSSWMPEVRHIRDHSAIEKDQSQYVEDLLDSVLLKGGIENVRDCTEEKDKDITFTEHFFYYTGDLK